MLVITGGAGFIGSNFLDNWLKTTAEPIINIDKLTYAGNLQNLAQALQNERHFFVKADIGDAQAVSHALSKYQPRAIINFAAESHVDRSIHDPDSFVQTNVFGTLRLLKAAFDYWNPLDDERRRGFRFLQVSTDEVYGSLEPDDPPFTEQSPYTPNNPYAASKAAADHMVRAFHRTYGLPTVITNCSNNYGPRQFPEKLIPLTIHNALSGKPIPIYGDGMNVRDWIYVTDHCRGIQAVLESGRVGETYNIGACNEETNIELTKRICTILDEARPQQNGESYRGLISFVADRRGHDRRYAIDASKAERELDWRPSETLKTGLHKTVHWYLENQEWVANVTTGAYRDWVALNYGERASSA